MPQGHEDGDKIVAKVDRQIRLPRPSLRCSPWWPLLVRYAILERHAVTADPSWVAQKKLLTSYAGTIRVLTNMQPGVASQCVFHSGSTTEGTVRCTLSFGS